MIKNQPLVSIVTPYYREGKKYLKGYFESLKNQSYKNIEIIFVDNGSKDDAVEYVRKHYKEAKIFRIEENEGITKGKNYGVSMSKGEFIVLLDNDTSVEKDYIKKMVNAFDEIPRASIIQSKILLMKDKSKIDTCGSFWTNTGFAYHYGNGKQANLNKYNRSFPIFSVKSASMIIKREVIEKIGMYDENYWGFYEETDLCHRAWIAGFETWYYPKAYAIHAFGGTSLTYKFDFLQYHNFKNKLFSFLANFENKNLVHLIPKYLIFNILIGIGWLFQGKFKHTLSLFKALWWNIRNYKLVMQTRNKVQNTRKLSDDEIDKIVKVNPRLSYYYHLFTTDLSKYTDDNI